MGCRKSFMCRGRVGCFFPNLLICVDVLGRFEGYRHSGAKPPRSIIEFCTLKTPGVWWSLRHDVNDMDNGKPKNNEIVVYYRVTYQHSKYDIRCLY